MRIVLGRKKFVGHLSGLKNWKGLKNRAKSQNYRNSKNASFLVTLLCAGVLSACGVAVDQASLPQNKAPTSTEEITETGIITNAAGRTTEGPNTESAVPPTQTGPNSEAEPDPVLTQPSKELKIARLNPSIAGVIDRAVPSSDDRIADDQATQDQITRSQSNLDQSEEGKIANNLKEDAPVEKDVVGSIIWNIETAQKNKTPVIEPKIPVGPDESLAAEALEAAFSMLAAKQSPPIPKAFKLPAKGQGITRIALLIPQSGANINLGNELLRGAELALFSLRDPQIELMVFDTESGPNAEMAARQAIDSQADIIVGPLFSDAVIPARVVTRNAGLPMLALSNNAEIAASGSWLFGYMPEQQVDLLLGHALTAGRGKIGIIAENSSFGQRLARHAAKRLGQFGLRPEDMMTLNADQLADEDQLKSAIRTFTGYEPPAEDEGPIAVTDLPPPRFDAVLFAGSADFALRTAPVLAYYDADSERVLYLGNAQWNQSRILSEPSLQGGLFTSRPTAQDEKFNALWSEVWENRPGALARLSFDAMAMMSVLAKSQNTEWRKALVSETGFSGFSGAYRLLPNGGNQRSFELRQISGGISTLVQPAPDKI